MCPSPEASGTAPNSILKMYCDAWEAARKPAGFSTDGYWDTHVKNNKYAAHLNSDRWKQIRQRVMERAGYVCEQLGCARTADHVHHATYKNLGDEPIEDLLALCYRCHQAKHPDRPLGTSRRKKKKRMHACPFCRHASRKARYIFDHIAAKHPHVTVPSRDGGERMPVWEQRARQQLADLIS